jgi:membrane-associated HD superfamily phosphohydrolase
MTLGKMVRSLSIGFIFGILAIGLLPFLVIFNFAEMLNIVELEASPLYMLLGRLIGRAPLNDRTDQPQQEKDLDQ